MKRFHQKPEIVYETIDNQTYILLPKKGKMVELNPTASFIWENIKKPKNINQLIKRTCQEFKVDKQQAKKDIQQTINKFLKLNLINGTEK
jgi:hypothetical protein